MPVNQTALQAGVVGAAADAGYRLTVTGRCRRPLTLSVADLQALPQRTSALPITCVEGWSADAVWRGVPLGSLLALAEAPRGASVRVESLEDQHRLYSSSVVDGEHADDPDTLLALELNGEDARPRPRIPGPPDRTRPAGRAPDQMDLEGGRPVTDEHDGVRVGGDTAAGVRRGAAAPQHPAQVASLIVGWAVIVFALHGMISEPASTIRRISSACSSASTSSTMRS